jgi:NTE family protein
MYVSTGPLRHAAPCSDQPWDLSDLTAVRMSVSIPYFFEPVVLERVLDDQGKPMTAVSSTIIDGGILSNFPVWLFDTPQPRRPTFGFTSESGLAGTRNSSAAKRSIPWPIQFGLDLLQASRDAWDVRFVSRSTSVRTVTVNATVRIPGGHRTVRSTEFDIPNDLQTQLIENGRQAATQFLDRFDPSEHNSYHAPAPAPTESPITPTGLRSEG